MDSERMFIEIVLRSLVDYPEDVVVDKLSDDRGHRFRIDINPVDFGRVIGKQGATIKALKTLLHAIGAHNGEQYTLFVMDHYKETAK